jgi:hypothetical protein
MLDPFTFEADDRTFDCQIAALHARAPDAWWWFRVSGDPHRYAPFRPAEDETRSTVQYRILDYYRDLRDRRALPYDRGAQRSHWKR